MGRGQAVMQGQDRAPPELAANCRGRNAMAPACAHTFTGEGLLTAKGPSPNDQHQGQAPCFTCIIPPKGLASVSLEL